MKIKIENGKEFANMLVFASGVLTDARMLITKEGISIREMDVAKVAMVGIDLLAKGIKEYPDIEEPIQLGLALDELTKWMRKVKPKDALILDIKFPDIKFVIDGDYRRSIKYVSIDMGEADVPMPDLDLKAVYDMPTKLLRDVIEGADIVASSLEIKGDNYEIEFKGEGDTKEYEATIQMDDKEVHSVETLGEDETVTSKFTVSYLKSLVKPNMGEQVQMRLSHDMPIMLVYRYIDENDFAYATVTTFLAPRIEED